LKFARFTYREGSRKKDINWGIVKGENIELIKGSPYGEWEPAGNTVKDFEVQLLAPCEPTKIIGVGLNYQDHADELNMTVPDEPVIFLKPPTAVINPEEYIVKPSVSSRLDYEAELAVIIGRRAQAVQIENIHEYILGYTCINDVTARDIQRKDGQWSRAKSFDTFAPVGPFLVSEIDPNRLKIELMLNDETMQSSSTANMVFRVEKLVSFVSCVMTLNPGDIIATGTPPGVGAMQSGDVVEVEIEKIGTLRNYVTDREQ